MHFLHHFFPRFIFSLYVLSLIAQVLISYSICLGLLKPATPGSMKICLYHLVVFRYVCVSVYSVTIEFKDVNRNLLLLLLG